MEKRELPAPVDEMPQISATNEQEASARNLEQIANRLKNVADCIKDTLQSTLGRFAEIREQLPQHFNDQSQIELANPRKEELLPSTSHGHDNLSMPIGKTGNSGQLHISTGRKRSKIPVLRKRQPLASSKTNLNQSGEAVTNPLQPNKLTPTVATGNSKKPNIPTPSKPSKIPVLQKRQPLATAKPATTRTIQPINNTKKKPPPKN